MESEQAAPGRLQAHPRKESQLLLRQILLEWFSEGWGREEERCGFDPWKHLAKSEGILDRGDWVRYWHLVVDAV